jgi:hypothetical protein
MAASSREKFEGEDKDEEESQKSDVVRSMRCCRQIELVFSAESEEAA